MTEAKAKGKKKLPTATSFSSPNAAGWLFKMIHDGWLNKKFKKRYCVLSAGMLYFYEFKESQGTEKTCGAIDLKHYQMCTNAAKKEVKKNPTAFILQVKEQKANSSGKPQKKQQQNAQRELFYAENEDSQIEWMAKLNEAISLSIDGGGKKLEHVTKTRAKPPGGKAGGRRPPTKSHLKERAKFAEVTLEEPSEPKSPKEKRGKIPTTAIKPPPLKKPSVSVTEDPLPSPPPLPTDLPSPPPAILKPPLDNFTPVTIEKADSNASSSSHLSGRSFKSNTSSSLSPTPDFDLPPPPTEIEIMRCNSDRVVVTKASSTNCSASDDSIEEIAKSLDHITAEVENNNNTEKIKNGGVKQKRKKKEKKKKGDKNKRPSSLIIL